jgi:hypothetical protein
MTKYLFFSNFARDLGVSAIYSAVLFGSGYYLFSNFDDLRKLFITDPKTEDEQESNDDDDDVSPKPMAIKNEPENEPKKKSWFWFM